MQHTIQRRQAIAAGAGAFASIAFLRTPAKAAQFTMKYGHNLTEDHPLNVRMVQAWNEVDKLTNGELKVTTFANNQLGNDTSMLEQLRSGALQFMTVSGGYLARIVPVAQIDLMPFAFKNQTQVFKALDGALGDYVRQAVAAKMEILLFQEWALGFREITSNFPIRTVADMQGFKLRTPPGRMWVDSFKALGAVPAPIDFAEEYTALQTHVVDGQETPYSIIVLNRFYEVQKFLSVTNHMWTGNWFSANKEAWNSLPPNVRDIVTKTVAKYAVMQRRDVEILNASMADKLQRMGMTFIQVDPSAFRAKLTAAGFYAKWKADLGDQPFALLEAVSGKLT